MGVPSLIQGLVSRVLPATQPDSATPLTARMTSYREVMVQPIFNTLHSLSDEGSYFVCTNPTPGTAIATTTSITGFAETAGAVGVVFLLTNPPTSTKRLYLDYIKLMVVQVPTSATSWQYALVTDTNQVRYTSGGSNVTSTIVNPNSAVSNTSVATAYFGALTTAVPVNRRTVGRGTIRGVIPTTFDEMVILCGNASGAGAMASAAASSRSVSHTSPIIVGPGTNLALTLWGASNAAAPTYEFEVGWAER